MNNKNHRYFQCGTKRLDLSQPHVMGVLNVTPDSFSDGGHFNSIDKAVAQGLAMEDAGASFIDIGGESTRPGATEVTVEEELERTIPVIETLAKRCDCLISIDTSTPDVITAAAQAGAHLINDVRALQRTGALEAAARTGLPVGLMHMQNTPQTMQDQPHYNDVISEIKTFLIERMATCIAAGIDASMLMIDPGFGFGKTLEHNLALLAGLKHFEPFQSDITETAIKPPLLVGLSRKSMIGTITGKTVDQRMAGSIAAALLAVENGANIVRVHDVAETVDALKVWSAVNDHR